MKTQVKTIAISAISGALIVGGIGASPAIAAPGDQAVISVSKSTGLNPEGETITVTGSGFVSNANLTNATRLPLAPGFGGAYISFGKFQDVWAPSVGAPRGNRLTTFADASRTKWLVPEANLAQIGGAAAGGAILAPDGTFTVTLNVSQIMNVSGTDIFDEATIGNYGIFSYLGGGGAYAPFETFTPLTFIKPIAPVEPIVAAKLPKKITSSFRFSSGVSKVSKSQKRQIRNRTTDYRVASAVVITASAGRTPGVSERAVRGLAKKRANAIKKYLVSQGVPAEKIVIKTRISKSGKKPSTKIVATP